MLVILHRLSIQAELRLGSTLLILKKRPLTRKEIVRSPNYNYNDRSLRERLHTHKVFTKTSVFYLDYHKFSINDKIICFGCVLESPRPQHMILWRNIKNYSFLSF